MFPKKARWSSVTPADDGGVFDSFDDGGVDGVDCGTNDNGKGSVGPNGEVDPTDHREVTKTPKAVAATVTTPFSRHYQDKAAAFVSWTPMPTSCSSPGKLNLTQQIRLLSGLDMWKTKVISGYHSKAPKGEGAIPHVPSVTVADGPHGLRKQEGTNHTDMLQDRVDATCFPTASAMACSWNSDLLRSVGEALSRECAHQCVGVLLGPGINLHRHPCGGRNFEYFSEDPLLTGLLAKSLITGIQSTGRTAACAKHFVCNNQETKRMVVDAIIDERTLRELYLRAFEICLKRQDQATSPSPSSSSSESSMTDPSVPWTVMTSYNRVNGIYTSEHPFLLQRVLREEWNFDGLVMSDWGGVNDRCQGIATSMDLEMPGSFGAYDDIVEAALAQPQHHQPQTQNPLAPPEDPPVLLVEGGEPSQPPRTTDDDDEYLKNCIQESLLSPSSSSSSSSSSPPSSPAPRTSLVRSSSASVSASTSSMVSPPPELTREHVARSAQRVVSLALWNQEQVLKPKGYDDNPFSLRIPPNTSLLEQHHQMAYEAALETSVLLKNDHQVLPLIKPQPRGAKGAPGNNNPPLGCFRYRRIVVLGEFAQRPRYQGMGSSQVKGSRLDAPWDCLSRRVEGAHASLENKNQNSGSGAPATTSEMAYPVELVYSRTYHAHDALPFGKSESELSNVSKELATKQKRLLDDAVETVQNRSDDMDADDEVVLFFAGLPESYESEGFDRDHMRLPAQQVEAIETIAAIHHRVVIILSNGAAVLMTPWIDKVAAVVEGWLPGQAGGNALVDLLLGNAVPSGKLAQTIVLASTDIPSDRWFPGTNKQVQHREGLNVGYRWYESAKIPVLFPFGHGMSYTSFEYSNLNVTIHHDSPERGGQIDVEVTLTIHNTGLMAGKEVVQCYIHDAEATVYRPEQELKAFAKTRLLQPNESTLVSMRLSSNAFAYWDVGHGSWWIEPGDFEIRIGSSSRDLRLSTSIRLDGAKELASVRAQQSHPPRSFPLPATLPDSDADFEAMLEGPIPPPPTMTYGGGGSCCTEEGITRQNHHTHRVHPNTLVGDVQHLRLGRRLLRAMLIGFEMHVPPITADSDEEQIQVVANQKLVAMAFATNSALRNLVTFSQGYLSFQGLDLILLALNSELLKALWKLPWFLFIHMPYHFWTLKQKTRV